MKEDFLQFLWENKLFKTDNLKTVEGDKVEILNHGFRNTDAGADFLNAKIKIDDKIWAGNIEIHFNSSDWNKHKHHENKAYNNVILHVVKNFDKESFRENGEKIATLILDFNPKIFESFELMLKNKKWIACENEIKSIEFFYTKQWLNRLFIERLETKSNSIIDVLKQNQFNWEETFYQHLAKNFGQKTNSQPFEMLAKSLPMKYLAKQKDNLLQIEAMLFGQAGFLDDVYNDEYYNKLKKEYLFLNQKFDLKPIEKHLWKFLRLRPSNFPTIRIAQFANLIYKSNKLFSKILEINDLNDILDLFDVSASKYWDTHYNFDKESAEKKKKLGNETVYNIIINTVIQFLFTYGKVKKIDTLVEKSIDIAENIKSESNSILDKWKEIGLNSENSLESQALLQLKNEYCNYDKCTTCQIGRILIKKFNQ